MNKKLYVLILLLAVAALWMLPQGAFAQYVGTQRCNDCHGKENNFAGTQWATWVNTKHNMKWRDPDEGLGVVIHDAFANALDLSTTPAFASFGANAPVLGFDATDPGDSADGKSGYSVTIAGTKYEVNWTLGGTGDWKQRYMTEIGNSIYILPIQYNEKTGDWVTYHTATWYDGTTPKAAPPLKDSYERRCIGCHTVNPDVSFDAGTGEWTATYTERNIGCEACHGPGGPPSHVNYGTDLTGQGVNPEKLTDKDRKLEVCGACHGRGSSTATLGGETLGYPYSDTNGHYKPGEVLADYYTQTTSSSNFWPNVEPYGRNSKSHHQQYLDFLTSGHYLATPGAISTYQADEEVQCWSCHDPHGNTPNEHLLRDKIVEDGLEIPTDNDNNTLCLSCHSTHEPFAGITKEMVADPTGANLDAIKAVVTKHTNHSYDPTGTGASRCSKCHNPKVAKSAINYDIHSHTFWVISPGQTLAHQAEGGMPNSCAVSCHVKEGFPNFGVDIASDDFATWNEQTDIDLAKELLFWHDNMWFEELGGEGKTIDVPEVTTAPTVDGDTTDWAGVPWVNDIPLAQGNMVSMKAAVTTTDIYFLIQWADPTLSMTRSGSWSYDGAKWNTSSGQSEDRIAIMWNISIPEAEWNERGCMNKCHRDVDNTNAGNDTTTGEDDAFLPAGQKADMWHMKAARSLGVISATQTGALTIDAVTHEVTAGKVTLVGYIDDKYIGPFSADNAPDGGRYGDEGGSTYARNRNAAKDGPLYIETDPADYIDAMTLTQAEIDNGEAILVTDVADLASVWAKYAGFSAVVPERILRPPVGSRGDIMQAATWDNGVWYTEIKRVLNTGHDDDAQFTVGSFKFGIALMDNGGGEDHWTTGSVLNTLDIKSITAVESDEVAAIPERYSLYQNYPNPFNPTTNIEFDVVEQGPVTLKVYNVIGEEVATVLNKVMPAGRQRVTFDGADLATGVYFYRLEVNGFVATKKLLLMK